MTLPLGSRLLWLTHSPQIIAVRGCVRFDPVVDSRTEFGLEDSGKCCPHPPDTFVICGRLE